MNDTFDASTIRLKPYYIFSAISLALVILLLAILFPRKSVYIAEAQLAIKPAAGSETIADVDLPQLVRSLITDPQHLERAVGNLAPELSASFGVGGDSLDVLGAVVREHLNVELSGESSEQQLTIRFGNPVRTTALNVVASLAHQFAMLLQERGKTDDQAAEVRVAELKQRITDVRQRRQQYVDEYVERQQQAVDRRDGVGATSPFVGDSAPPDQPAAAVVETVPVFPDLVDSTQESAAASLEGIEPADEPANSTARDHLPVAVAAQPVWVEPEVSATAQASVAPAQADRIAPAHPQGAEIEARQGRKTPKPRRSADAEADLPATADLAETPRAWPVAAPAAEGPAPTELDGNSSRNTLSADPPLTPPTRSIAPEPDLPQLVEPNPEWIAISEQIAGLRAELREMLRIYTPTHPLAEDMLRRIEDLELKLKVTQQFIEIPSGRPIGQVHWSDLEPTPSYGPVPATENPVNEATSPTEREDEEQQQRARWVEDAVRSARYRELTDELEQLRSELAEAIHRHQQQSDALRGIRVEVRGEPQATSVRTGALSLFDILTYLVPACIVGLAASVIRRPDQPPLELYSVADVENALGLQVVGAISTKDGPQIPAPQGGEPPNSILRLVFASEVLLVATAVVLVISFFQIPQFAAELARNPIAALVMSIDYSLDIIRDFF